MNVREVLPSRADVNFFYWQLVVIPTTLIGSLIFILVEYTIMKLSKLVRLFLFVNLENALTLDPVKIKFVWSQKIQVNPLLVLTTEYGAFFQ